jgi:hypothetical protein
MVGEGSIQLPQPEDRPLYASTPVDPGPSLLARIGTTLLDVVPVVGGLKSAGQVITGTEFGTGERVNRWEEGLGVVLGALGLKFLTKVDDIADIGADVARQVRRGADGGVTRTVAVPRSRYPEGTAHIEDAQASGHPRVLTVDRAGTAANRTAAQAGHARRPGMDLDEYPPAMFREGGSGASVRPMTPAQNRGMGSCIGNQCRGVPDGSQVEIIVVD